jgi:hypothetical protein
MSVPLEGWERDHLWGPRWGDEAAAGIGHSPSDVNQLWQNHGIETELDGLRDRATELGGSIVVDAERISQPRNLEGGAWGDCVSQLTYKVYAESPKGELTELGLVVISVDPPPGNHAELMKNVWADKWPDWFATPPKLVKSPM